VFVISNNFKEGEVICLKY